MGLKTLLQNWLGMAELKAELKAELDRAQERQITDATLRKEIADAFEMVLAGERPRRHVMLWGPYFPDEGRRVDDTVRRVTGEQAEAVARQTVEARIGGEAFIDELVARVRRKQLDA